MWVTRDKEGELVSMSPLGAEAIQIAEKYLTRDEFIIHESLDQIELFEIYRNYYNRKYK
jgi:hypothetical protein